MPSSTRILNIWCAGSTTFSKRACVWLNMLGCHDGIPLLDLKGLLPEERIQAMVETLKAAAVL